MADDPKRFGWGAGPVILDWVSKLPLRYQGVLMGLIRGCDSVPKEDPSKAFVRAYRSFVLNTPSKEPSSFIEFLNAKEVCSRGQVVRKNCDHLPHHFVMHMIHAIEIVGYHHPDEPVRNTFFLLYLEFCRGLHMKAETEAGLKARLCAVEKVFAKDLDHDS